MELSPKLRKLLSRLPLRLLLSVMAGIAVAMALSFITHLVLWAAGIFPPPFKPMFETSLVITSLVYHSVFAFTGAVVTAWLACNKARKAIFILGSKEAIMWVLGMLLLWHHSPPWYNITKAVLGPPIAWLGGKLYQHYKKKHPPKEEKNSH